MVWTLAGWEPSVVVLAAVVVIVVPAAWAAGEEHGGGGHRQRAAGDPEEGAAAGGRSHLGPFSSTRCWPNPNIRPRGRSASGEGVPQDLPDGRRVAAGQGAHVPAGLVPPGPEVLDAGRPGRGHGGADAGLVGRLHPEPLDPDLGPDPVVGGQAADQLREPG